MPNPPKSLSWFEMMADKLSELRQSKLSFTRAKQMFAGVLKSEKKKRKKYFKKIGGEHAERYAASFVSASVVPNLYPTLRVFEYNITGLDIKFLEEGERSLSIAATPEFDQKILESQKTKTKKKKKGKKKYKFDVPKSPSKSSPPGPAYSPQTFSMVRFTQYLANLTHINNDFQALSSTDLDGEEYVNATGWKEGKHKGKKPHNKDHTPEPKKFKYEVHYDTRDDDVYQLKDLTMPSIVDLATRIGKFEPVDDDSIEDSDCASTDDDLDAEKKKNKKHKKKKKARQKQNEAWYTFVRRAFVETLSPEELHDEFGV
jgi:endopolyphosphatase